MTTFEYDTVGNLTRIGDPLGNTTTRSYDTVSRLIRQTDPRGKATQFAYDALNRLTQLTDPLNGRTTFTYDPNGNLLTVMDARGSTTSHTYDTMDRLSTRTDPLGRGESYQYDGVGNLTQFTDRKNQVSTFAYDALNRRTRATFGDGAFTEFVYDAAGRLTAATDSLTGAITEEYDVLNRLIRETTPQGSIQYGYDAVGRRTTMTVNGQAPVAYSYDAASRLRTITQAPLTPVDLQYDPSGRRTLLRLPNGVTTAYDYDLASRLTRLTYTNPTTFLGDLTYQYDPAGNRTAVGGSFARTLLPDPVSSATYDAANQQLALGNKTMTYDNNGNLVTLTEAAATTTFTWDARNRLTALSGPALTANFQYDALGRRHEKVINARRSTFQYDRADTVGEVLDGTEVTYLRTQNIDETLILRTGGTAFSYLADALGSSVALLDGAGAIATSYSYDPFGRTAASGMLTSNAFQFTGRENDGTGFYYYRARFYSPGLSRFISEDPLGFRAGRNFYRYAQNTPMTLTDPSGLVVSGAILRGLNAALRTGATGGEIAVQAKVVDSLLGPLTAAADKLLPSGATETPIPGAGDLTVGNVLDIATGASGVQALGLGAQAAAAGGLGAGAAVGILGGAGGLSIGIAINNLILDNPALFPEGNPVERLFCFLFFDCEPPKGAFGRGR